MGRKRPRAHDKDEERHLERLVFNPLDGGGISGEPEGRMPDAAASEPQRAAESSADSEAPRHHLPEEKPPSAPRARSPQAAAALQVAHLQ